MRAAELIRNARIAAVLTQVELARLGRTTQPAVAAYESGKRTPNLATLERLLLACDHDIEIQAHPRVRWGSASLAEVSRTIAEDLAQGDEAAAVRLLFGFADDFRGSSRAGRAALITKRPGPTGAACFDAALGGLAEFFAAEGGVIAPDWVNEPDRFVVPWWFVASRTAFHAYVLANTPALIARHGVFMAREVFDRV